MAFATAYDAQQVMAIRESGIAVDSFDASLREVVDQTLRRPGPLYIKAMPAIKYLALALDFYEPEMLRWKQNIFRAKWKTMHFINNRVKEGTRLYCVKDFEKDGHPRSETLYNKDAAKAYLIWRFIDPLVLPEDRTDYISSQGFKTWILGKPFTNRMIFIPYGGTGFSLFVDLHSQRDKEMLLKQGRLAEALGDGPGTSSGTGQNKTGGPMPPPSHSTSSSEVPTQVMTHQDIGIISILPDPAESDFFRGTV